MNNSRISAALAAVFAASAIAAFADVEPQDYYGKIAKRLVDMLPKSHVLQKKLDDDISQKAWTNLVTYYDFDHSVFLKSDLDSLAAREKRIDDEIHAGDASFGFDVYNLYCRRLSERMDFVTNFLATAEWDFSTNETYRIKRKDAPWPETAEEANEHWRRRLKNEVLVQVLGKPKARIKVPSGADAKALEAAALADAKVQEAIAGKTVRKVICVPGRLVNIVAN